MAEITDLTPQYKMPLVWPRLPLDVNRVDAVVIHHTVTFFLRPDALVAEELNHIQMIHLYHESKGFVGFGYHYIVFPSGRAYLVTSLKQWGVHTKENNDHLWGIAAAGDFATVLPNDFQRDGVTDCITACYEYRGKRLPVRGHKDYTLTNCPSRWYEILNELIPEEEEMDFSDEQKAYLADLEARIGRGIAWAVANGGMSADMKRGDPGWKPPFSLLDVLNELKALEAKVDAIPSGGVTRDEFKEAVKEAHREGTG